VQDAIEAAGAMVRYLPQYSPDLNPIEMPFSKVKAFLRKFSERTICGLCKRIGSFVPTIGCANVAITSGMPAMHPYDRNLL
jgi:transposase